MSLLRAAMDGFLGSFKMAWEILRFVGLVLLIFSIVPAIAIATGWIFGTLDL